MQTRKDLYQAYRLMQQRLGQALLQGEPDVAESPMRRHNLATFCGVLLSVLLLAVFGIWGVVKPGGATKLTEPGQLLVEQDTGATYVYSQQERVLLPVANYVSARLLLDAADVTVRDVSAASLAELPRGPLVGIPGAPDSLPAKDKLVRGPWSVCVVDGPDPTGAPRPYVTLIGGVDVGGKPLGGGAMVVDDGRQMWVVWGDRRMRASASAVSALNAQPRKVPAAWLNAVPPGPDFSGPKVAHLGRKVRGPDGKVTAAVGQVFTVPGLGGAPARWYVLLSDGLAPITLTQATLLLADPGIKAAYGKRPRRPITIDAATANASLSKQNVLGGGLPETLPEVVSPSSTTPLCAVYAGAGNGSTRATLTVGSSFAIPTPRTPGGQDTFDQVLLPPGSAAIAGLLPGEGQLGSITNYFLVTDQGRRFALASADLLPKLGYDVSDATPVPANLLHLIPEGPMLDPAAARKPVEIGK
ncbi:type VII secretion protein EccB [Microbispora rosea subsp. aerata]|nr:type VII secretion protein EccB [Microbispora rosea]GGO18065.1 type VII secretion protein EccB [Microbispora rosea subsp. aerata]GIH56720.1 type VII secretion protein EccB [Microbispora rosea subsp. aerata]GLJ82093.1 type VII secretion protein EccB [Microbispora rosea subsp. aerata]